MIPGPNWTRRYGSPSRRLCARAGCGATAAATLRFQPTRREAWLVELDGTATRAEGDLCARHATALVLPRGWALHDERADAETVLVAESGAGRDEGPLAEPTTAGEEPLTPPTPSAVVAPASLARLPRTRRPRRSRRPEPVPAPAIGPAAEGADLADLLDAQTPLLRRAFGNIPLD